MAVHSVLISLACKYVTDFFIVCECVCGAYACMFQCVRVRVREKEDGE